MSGVTRVYYKKFVRITVCHCNFESNKKCTFALQKIELISCSKKKIELIANQNFCY